jgi:hypothetical protein
MAEGFVGFMRRNYYWVLITIALTAGFFAIFYPIMVIVIIAMLILLTIFFIFYHYKKEITKFEQPATVTSLAPMMKVEDVSAPLERYSDIDSIVEEARSRDRTVGAHVLEGSGLALIERYFPLGEMLFPLSFIADPESTNFQDGSVQVGEPLCLWHGESVWFTQEGGGQKPTFMYHCSKCPKGGHKINKSLRSVKKDVNLIATTTLKSGKMPISSENLLEATKRGRGELPG